MWLRCFTFHYLNTNLNKNLNMRKRLKLTRERWSTGDPRFSLFLCSHLCLLLLLLLLQSFWAHQQCQQYGRCRRLIFPFFFLSPCFVRASSDVRPSEKTKTKKDLKERNEEDSLCGLYMDCDGVDSNRTPASSLPFRGFSFVSISFYVWRRRTEKEDSLVWYEWESERTHARTHEITNECVAFFSQFSQVSIFLGWREKCFFFLFLLFSFFLCNSDDDIRGGAFRVDAAISLPFLLEAQLIRRSSGQSTTTNKQTSHHIARSHRREDWRLRALSHDQQDAATSREARAMAPIERRRRRRLWPRLIPVEWAREKERERERDDGRHWGGETSTLNWQAITCVCV